MRKFTYVILFSFLISSCHKKEIRECDSLKSYIYSNAEETRVFTAKLTCEDTIFLTEYYPTHKSFYALNERKQKFKIDSLFNQVNFKNIQKEYIEEFLQDGEAFRIVIQNQDRLDSILVYGEKAPKIINQISNEFKKTIKSLKFIPYSKDIDYGKHHINLVPPPPPPKNVDTITFKELTKQKILELIFI